GRDRSEDHAHDPGEVSRRTGWGEHDRGFDLRGSRHHRGGLRALSDPARLSQPHTAWPCGHALRLRILQRETGARKPLPAGAVLSKLVYLGLGSNVGDRERQLQEAVGHLAGIGLREIRTSPIYETEPVEYTAQRWFLNQ